MPARSAKPWFHKKSGYWCTSKQGRRIYLDREYRVAAAKLRQLRASDLRVEHGGNEWLDAPFAVLADEFMEDVKARRAEATYQSYRYRLGRALRILGPKLRVGELRKIHLAKIEQKLTGTVSPTTVKDTIATVQCVFSWAVKHDLLIENPLIGFEKPRGRSRTRIITPTEFQSLLRHADPSFRRFLIALSRTGCRPGEARLLTWEAVDLEQRLWILHKHKTVTRQRCPMPRIIPLDTTLWKLCCWLRKRMPSGTDHVFLGGNAKPFGKDMICRKMARLRKRAGIQLKGGEQLVLYSTRHTFGTASSGRISDIELANLMGHTDIRTTQRYVHLNAERLRDALRRARGE